MNGHVSFRISYRLSFHIFRRMDRASRRRRRRRRRFFYRRLRNRAPERQLRDISINAAPRRDGDDYDDAGNFSGNSTLFLSPFSICKWETLIDSPDISSRSAPMPSPFRSVQGIGEVGGGRGGGARSMCLRTHEARKDAPTLRYYPQIRSNWPFDLRNSPSAN